jgi:hypothetical protein
MMIGCYFYCSRSIYISICYFYYFMVVLSISAYLFIFPTLSFVIWICYVCHLHIVYILRRVPTISFDTYIYCLKNDS